MKRKTEATGVTGIYRRGDRLLVAWMNRGRFCRKLLAEGATLTDAKEFRTIKLGEVASGKLAADLPGRFTVADLLKLLPTGLKRPPSRALKEAWPTLLARDLTAEKIRAFEAERLAAGKARATVNADLAALRRAFNIAVEDGRLAAAPKIRTPNPQNARQGFFEEEQLNAVLAKLPAHLRPVALFAHHTGWRVRSEVLPLAWKQVDWRAGVVRLEPGTTKNREGREFPFAALPALKQLLEAQLAAAEPVSASRVFFDPDGRALDYKHVRLAWRAACRKAKLAGRLLHDLRRTAVRNLVRAGVAQVVAMSLTGHKTTAVFQRYAIIDSQLQREGVAKLAKAARRTTRVLDLLKRRTA